MLIDLTNCAPQGFPEKSLDDLLIEYGQMVEKILHTDDLLKTPESKVAFILTAAFNIVQQGIVDAANISNIHPYEWRDSLIKQIKTIKIEKENVGIH